MKSKVQEMKQIKVDEEHKLMDERKEQLKQKSEELKKQKEQREHKAHKFKSQYEEALFHESNPLLPMQGHLALPTLAGCRHRCESPTDLIGHDWQRFQSSG